MVSHDQGRRFGSAAALTVALIAAGCSPGVTRHPPAATPVVIEEPLASTLGEARALRAAGKLDLFERSLRKLATTSPDADERRRASAMLAVHLFDVKRYAEAVPALDAAAAGDPLIAPFLRLRVIDALAASGKPTDAIATAVTIIQASPETSAAASARLRLPPLYALSGNEGLMNGALEQITAIKIDELTEPDFADLADRLANAGKREAAASIRMRLLREYPQGRTVETTYNQLASMGETPLDALTTDEAVHLASDLARFDRYDQALDLLRRISGRADVAENDLYRAVRVRALFYSRNYAQLLTETTAGTLGDPALELLRARAAWRSGRPEEFLTGLALVESQYPARRQAADAKVLRSKFYTTDEVDYAKAVADLSSAIDAGAAGTDGENIWTLGWTYLLWGDLDDALKTFARYIASYPDGDFKTNSLFWSAKIEERHRDTGARDAVLSQITSEFPYSYYAYRAREIMGQPAVAPSDIAGGAIFPDVDAQLAAITGGRIETIRELLAVDLSRDATQETKTLAAEYPDNAGAAFLLADVYVKAGELFKANGVLQRRFRQFVRHGGSQIPQRFWEILFPLQYWDVIEREAAARGLDPFLIASIIRQESGFEPSTVSNAGAVGLMQIMPEEAERIAGDAGLAAVTRQQLFDPEVNIAVGAAEYSQKLKSMHDNPILAIAAYNAGEVGVGKWLAQWPVDDMDLFVETIPYAETKLYVKSVMRNRFEYRRIYGGNTEIHQTP